VTLWKRIFFAVALLALFGARYFSALPHVDKRYVDSHAPSELSSLQTFLAPLRTFLVERLQSVFPEPESSLAAGLLFGHRATIPWRIKEDFQKTGLTHILAISGYNMVILIAFISTVFSIFPRNAWITLSLVSIFLFTLLVGASASVVRAAIMGSLTLVGRIFGRKSIGLRSLFVTGYIMILMDPFLLFFYIGFQLSFAATAGILLFSESLKTHISFFPNWFGMKDTAVATWAAQIFTTPIILFYFKGLSLIAPLANIIIVPCIPFFMLGSFLSLFFGKIIAAPTAFLFELMLAVIHWFARLPFAFMEVGIS